MTDAHVSLEHFLALGSVSEPLALMRARDDAFRRYGELCHLRLGDSRASVSVHPAYRDDPAGAVGCIGNIVLGGDRADLLGAAESWFRRRQVHWMRGPILRHTWYPFRAVTAGYTAYAPLSGEPQNPPDLAQDLMDLGFAVYRQYVTTWTDRLMQVTESAHKLSAFERAGFFLRALNPATMEGDLHAIYRLIHESFHPPQNTMFVPLDWREFLLALGLLGQGDAPPFDPFWVRLCFAPDGEAIGFVFMTVEEDLASIKTLCVSPRFSGQGVGGALVALAHQLARGAGLTWVAHTLMSSSGPSMSITAAGSHAVMRRYALFEKRL